MSPGQTADIFPPLPPPHPPLVLSHAFLSVPTKLSPPSLPPASSPQPPDVWSKTDTSTHEANTQWREGPSPISCPTECHLFPGTGETPPCTYAFILSSGLLRTAGSAIKSLPASAGDERDVGLIPGSGRSPGEGNGNPLQYSCLGNSMDRGARRAPWSCKELDMTEHTHKTVLWQVFF